MSHLAAILRSISPKANISAIIHNYVDDFNRDRLHVNRDTSSAACIFEQSIHKQACRAQLLEGPPTKTIMPRSTFDRLLDALQEISAEARDSQDIIVDHYDLHSYSTRPHLPFCLFYRRLRLVLPDDVLSDVLHILWVFTDGITSQLQTLALSICAHIPPFVILQFTRTMQHAPPPSLSVPEEEPVLKPVIMRKVSTFGPNSQCSYLPRLSLSKELPTQTPESSNLQKQSVSTGAHPYPSPVIPPPLPTTKEQKTTPQGVDGHDSDNYSPVPRTNFLKPAAPRNVPRTLSLAPAKYEGKSEYPFPDYLKRKHCSPPTSPRKRRRLSVGSGKENVVGAQVGGDHQGLGGTSGAVSSARHDKKRIDIQATLTKTDLDSEGQAKNEVEESEGTFMERRQRLEGLLFHRH
ncbi:hypothetical protein BDZ89DRAFT_1137813 [Hymenopellis radicata]|nr:hypothetical protein BDZ89DRAFT_1137813 [Hymenopellis radicata]